ncbi:hypothetical protein DRQ32_06860 [bacterium]|nr:MAG: hypothetical protein DRQ32_06860 [bacterium]
MKARWVLLAALLLYVVWLIFGYRYHFLDGVNLFLHEAGHLFFGIFGQTLHFLGGTLGQLVFPGLFVGHFWRRGQRFEAFIVSIWFAESMMYAAEYIGDAGHMLLPLVGGGIHDWNWLLRKWGMLVRAEGLGMFVHDIASFIAIGAIVCAGRELKRENSVAPRTPRSASARPTA